MSELKIHPFERAGLGSAPFTLVGHERRVGPIRVPTAWGYSECGSPGQPMGSCDYCGTGIADCFLIKSSDGKTFIVGSDCVAKTYRDSALADADKVAAKVAARVRGLRNDARHAREAARITKAREAFARPEVVAALQAKPHPYSEMAARGLTLADFCRWMFTHAGNAGMIRAAAVVEKVAA